MTITAASDPEKGIDLFYSKHPQAILTDLVMPRMSGIEVLERVVELDPTTDVIIMTAHYSAESAVEAIKKGVNAILRNSIVNLPPTRLRAESPNQFVTISIRGFKCGVIEGLTPCLRPVRAASRLKAADSLG